MLLLLKYFLSVLLFLSDAARSALFRRSHPTRIRDKRIHTNKSLIIIYTSPPPPPTVGLNKLFGSSIPIMALLVQDEKKKHKQNCTPHAHTYMHIITVAPVAEKNKHFFIHVLARAQYLRARFLRRILVIYFFVLSKWFSVDDSYYIHYNILPAIRTSLAIYDHYNIQYVS